MQIVDVEITGTDGTITAVTEDVIVGITIGIDGMTGDGRTTYKKHYNDYSVFYLQTVFL